jgi:molybdenum cofactor synthesis domain-containing protein
VATVTRRGGAARPSGRPAPKVRPDRTGPVRAEIFSIGRELLAGQVADRNARSVARFLAQRGAVVQRITIVGNEVLALASTLREALGRNPHLVVTTGGLGPGRDDVTVEAVAEALSLPLALDHDAKGVVEAGYRRLLLERRVQDTGLTAAREKMCRVPVGSIVLDNPAGVAPGVLCRLPGGAALLCLPGRPEEMEATLAGATDRLKLPVRATSRREVESPTADEASLRPLLDQLGAEFPAVWVSSRPSLADDPRARATILLEAVGDDEPQAESAAELALRRLLALAAGSP